MYLKNIPNLKSYLRKNKSGKQLKCMANVFNLPQLHI